MGLVAKEHITEIDKDNLRFVWIIKQYFSVFIWWFKNIIKQVSKFFLAKIIQQFDNDIIMKDASSNQVYLAPHEKIITTLLIMTITS